MIQYNSCLYIELNNLWIALYSSFNSVQSYQVNINLLAKIPNKDMTSWAPFSKELVSAIEKYNNLLTSRPDNLSLSRLLTVDFIFLFILLFFSFSFSIFRTTRVRVYQSRCHISHKLMAKSQDWSQDWENRVEGSGTKWRHTA